MKGAKVDGVMVALNYKLQTGQTVEIIAGKVGQPSRDWLNPELGYAASPRTRNKVRQWFNAQLTQRQIAEGRERIDKELARLGKTAVKLEALANASASIRSTTSAFPLRRTNFRLRRCSRP